MEWLAEVVQYLADRQLRLVTAESCTAGLIVSELARIPGSGQSIICGLAVYSPDAKHRLLDVEYSTIDRYGLTSEQVAGEMAMGALVRNAADVAVANTGVAGPTPPDDGTPVGTVCFSWAFRSDSGGRLYSETKRFDGDRNTVRLHAAHYALKRIPHFHEKSLTATV